jgi:3-hydroxyisobutyrate dehydrogenase
MNIGYVGLGNMGAALARRLQLCHPLIVYDQSATALQRLVDKGAAASPSLADIALRCDIIFLCLPTSKEVREVIFGDGGLATSAKRGTLFVDQTTGDPIATRAMAADLEARGFELIDAPVSGGPRGADAGTIAIIVGASETQFARIEPIVTTISPNVFHAGGVGSGDVMKLANNTLSAVNRVAGLEAIALAVKNGIEPKRAAEIILASSGRNFWLEHFIMRVLDGDITSGFTLGLSYKDVRLATQLGIDSDVPMFFGNLVREYYQMCINEVGRDAQVNTAALVMDRIAGTKMVPPSRAKT